MDECVTCGGELSVPTGTEINEIITCDDCGSELEVVSMEPLTLHLAPEEEEDWGE
ncbi:MAG: lysine biosynthesis protein LysW [Candidatus Undinarchaeales archaeon]|jgi:alpha-aminoadipate carrier protein LysW|nr:lysine biosynthesis protein LysW [Candidatus Undinarchaeales archaeon]MDP7494346.1 lysine biosynthesis protein LysW [Candidatus Undinarchaeales archaeon]